MVRASDSDRETRVRSSAGSVCCFLEQETFTPQKVLVIPRNRRLRLNMTEKLFTGTLNHNKNKNKNKQQMRCLPEVYNEKESLFGAIYLQNACPTVKVFHRMNLNQNKCLNSKTASNMTAKVEKINKKWPQTG